jgi:hypothetical protein
MTNLAINYGIAVASSSRRLSRLLPTYYSLHCSGLLLLSTRESFPSPSALFLSRKRSTMFPSAAPSGFHRATLASATPEDDLCVANPLHRMVTASIVLLYVSYAIPVICLLLRRRKNLRHGPFWLRCFGFISNVVLLCWTLFTIIMYSFPSLRPVSAGSKSSISARYKSSPDSMTNSLFFHCRCELRLRRLRRIVISIVVDWLARAKKSFRGQTVRHEEVTQSGRRALGSSAARDGDDIWTSGVTFSLKT